MVVMSLLACGYVDNVIIGAPRGITSEMIEKLHVNKVVHGKHEYHEEFYEDAVKAGIMDVFDSQSEVTALDVIERIKAMHDMYAERNSKKQR